MTNKRNRSDIADEIKKHVCLEKLRVPSYTQQDLVNCVDVKFGIKIGRSTVSDILKESAKWTTAETQNIKRHRSVQSPQLEDALVMWLNDVTVHHGISGISDDMLRTKAKEFGEILGISPDFKYSVGWLDKLKKRNGISQIVRHGEVGSVNEAEAVDAQVKLQNILCKYSPADIFNMDETALFYRLAPDRTLATQNLPGMKKSKERITVALCCNSVGSERLAPVVIGKAKNPRCFKNFNPNRLVNYYANTKAWMTMNVFLDWLQGVNRKFRSENRNIILLLDNHSSHACTDLSNVKILKFPPNMTSKLQPLDAGIIACFKRRFRKLQVLEWLSQIDNSGKMLPTDLKSAIYKIKLAWDHIDSSVISNCWKHTKILPNDNSTLESPNSLSLLDNTINDLSSLMKDLLIESQLSATEFVEIDNDQPTGEVLTEEEIFEIVTGNFDGGNSDDDDDEIFDSDVVTVAEAVKCLEKVTQFVEKNDKYFPNSTFANLSSLKKDFDNFSVQIKKQTLLTDYFVKE